MPENTSLKSIAEAIALNNHVDACIIVCPKGDGGQMHIATPTRRLNRESEPDDPPSPFQGTEVLWKDLARIIGAGADPVIMPRTEIASIVKGSNDVNEALGVLLMATSEFVKAVRIAELFDALPTHPALRDKVKKMLYHTEILENLVRKGFPK